ncbi:MAG TPA: flagellar basal body rod protein FlgB [Xanthobacteraceae bacterium]|jgi:flagellar basal-body rod protein FlgB|nr:flagellar basal body rod protein FlgB [Xanthobacteraceae bacterium]
MGISDLPIFSMLRTRMQWHQERQRVLAENVANADTPNYHPRDLSPPKFDVSAPQEVAPLVLARTEPGHIAGAIAGTTQFPTSERGGYEIRPAGNAVNLEDEMTKVAANQMDFQAATALYSRSLGLLKTALGVK